VLLLEKSLYSPAGLSDFDEIHGTLKRKLEKGDSINSLISKYAGIAKKTFKIPVYLEIDNTSEKQASTYFSIRVNQDFDKVDKSDFDIDLLKAYDIKDVKLVLTTGLIKLYSPRELTAVLLHEIGHIHDHVKSTSVVLNSYIRRMSRFIGKTAVILSFLTGCIPIIYIISRYAVVGARKTEYKSDEFCVRQGYGEELYSAISKIDDIRKPKSQNILKRILSVFTDVLFSRSEHPDASKRLKHISNVMLKNYENDYPDVDLSFLKKK
jgi:Zn-dependent protease with chaperone function